MNSSLPPIILDAATTLEIELEGIKLIEASAGTGKTYTIANLYLRHIFAGRDPSELLVVTFTNAATEELRGRIRARLHDTLRLLQKPEASDDEFLVLLLSRWQGLDQATQDLELRQLQLALRSMDEAAIYTIHGFCQRALTDHAFDSAQSFELKLLDDDRLLWEQALKDWWRRQSYILDSTDWMLFKACLKDLDSLLKWQDQIRANQPCRLLPEVNEGLQSLYMSWREQGDKIQALATQWVNQRAEIVQLLQQSSALSRAATGPYHQDSLADNIEQWDNYFNSDQPLKIPDSLRYLSSNCLVEKSTPAKRHSDPELESGFFLAVQETLQDIQNFQTRFRARALIEAHGFSRETVRAVKRENRSLAYQDQLGFLLEALQADNGDILGENLRRRFPVAMIDEFQDTDSIQFGIFYRLYFDQDGVSLTMIGDPKQSIYSFRGGDIFTYMKAKREASVQHFSLQTNWRSEPLLIEAVNRVFARREAAFIYAGSIDFAPVAAAPKEHNSALLVDGSMATPLTIWRIPLDQKQKPLSKERAYDLIHQATANEIDSLLREGAAGQVTIGAIPLKSADIAVLVRTSYEGNALRAVLSQKDIKAVTIGRDRVFDNEEATGLFELLQAIVHYNERRKLRTALASSLLQLDYSAIADVVNSEANWQSWQDDIRGLHTLWQKNGFIVMFQHLLQELKIGEKLAMGNRADRRLTNLLHIAELLQQQSRVGAGLKTLLSWFQQQVFQSSTEEAELRLESDEALVKIVTIHSCKGLEYPVVFIPSLWACKPADLSGGSLLRFHDLDHNRLLDLGSPDFLEHAFSAEKERLAEDIRLAYVALTRARSKVYLVWGDVGKKRETAKSALAYLLHPHQSHENLSNELPKAFEQSSGLDDDLKVLQDAAQEAIEIVALPQQAEIRPLEPRQQAEVQPAAASFKARPSTGWRISSFSALTQDIHQVAHRGGRGSSDDPILGFPAGSHVGLLLHSLLEHLDFQQNIQAQCRELLPDIARRYGFDSKDQQMTISNWMEILVQSPISDDGLCLSMLSCAQRLNELSFDFGLDYLDLKQINNWFAQMGGGPLSPISGHDFRGLITGVIDLVFEYRGKYYLADYKSNFLGANIGDYAPNKLYQAMRDRRYDLQYLLYSIALHRYLAHRVLDYRYETHFGGVYYLFLRGMRPQHGPKFGVYFDLPERSRIEHLDRLLASTPKAQSVQ